MAGLSKSRLINIISNYQYRVSKGCERNLRLERLLWTKSSEFCGWTHFRRLSLCSARRNELNLAVSTGILDSWLKELKSNNKTDFMKDSWM